MRTTSTVPLIWGGDSERVVVWHDGRPITQMALFADVQRLAAELPDRKHALNACNNRYAFIVALLAALLRNQVTVLPNDRTERVATALRAQYSGLYCLSDEEAMDRELETISVKIGTPTTDTFSAIPSIPIDQKAAIVFTSGSTGDPVPNEKSVRFLSTSAMNIAQRFAFTSEAANSVLATVPPQHMYGLETSISLPIWTGVSVHAGRPLYPADIAEALSTLPPPRTLVTTPIHLRALMTDTVNLPDLNMVISATAPLTQEAAQQVEQHFNTTVFEIYGSSEAGTVATRRTAEDIRWRTCDGITVHQLKQNCFIEASYYAAPVPMNDTIEIQSPDTFLLHGRPTDNVNIAGKRTSLNGLNTILNDIYGVTDGAFFLDEAKYSDRVSRLIAFVVAPTLSRDEIKNALRRAIDPAFVPRQIYRLPQLPRSDTGKLPHAALAELSKRLKAGDA